MKKMALLLMFITASLYGQTWIRSYQWNDLCPGPYTSGSAEVWNVIPAIGGGYLLQGHVEFSYGDIPAYEGNVFWLIDEFGAVIQRTTRGSISGVNSIVSNGVDRYYCLDSYQGRSFLDIYDADMNFLNHYWFAQVNGYDLQLNDMQFVDDGLVFAGQRNGQGVILKTDFAFNVVWQSNGVNTYHYGFVSMVQNNDTWIALAGRTLAEFSSVGDTLWSSDTYAFSAVNLDCIKTPNGDLISLGRLTSVKLFLIDTINQTLIPIYTGLDPSSIFDGGHIDYSNGNLIVLIPTEQGLLHKFSLQGALLWSREYTGKGSGSKRLICDSNGNIIFCAGTTADPIRLIKTNSDGLVVANDDPIIVTPVGSITHYPNPVNKSVTFTYGTTPINNKLLLEIYNIRGQKILSQPLQGIVGSLQINLEQKLSISIPNGIYLYRLMDGSKTLAIDKLVIMN